LLSLPHFWWKQSCTVDVRPLINFYIRSGRRPRAQGCLLTYRRQLRPGVFTSGFLLACVWFGGGGFHIPPQHQLLRGIEEGIGWLSSQGTKFYF
jgi:hypothetical protein